MKNEILFIVFGLPSLSLGLAIGVVYLINVVLRYVKTKQNKTPRLILPLPYNNSYELDPPIRRN